jgi:hypothetical protein
MRINANFKADLTGVKLNHDKETGTRTATPSVQFKVTEKEARSILGDTFYRTAFGGMADLGDGGGISFGYKKLTPAIVCEKHLLSICGHSNLAVMPELGDIVPTKDEAAVYVTLKFPLLVEGKSLVGDLAAAFGDVIDVHLTAAQLELPGTTAANMVAKRGARNYGNNKPVAVGPAVNGSGHDEDDDSGESATQ